jgi:hypothetical protein
MSRARLLQKRMLELPTKTIPPGSGGCALEPEVARQAGDLRGQQHACCDGGEARDEDEQASPRHSFLRAKKSRV